MSTQEHPWLTVCGICGRENNAEEEPWPNNEVCPNCEAEERFQATQRVQDFLDLDAAGFLMVALGHLVKAKEKLDQEPPSRGAYYARRATQVATNHARLALRALDELKEETCEKPSSN